MNKMLPGRATSLAQNVMKWIPVQNLPLRLVIMKRQKRWNLNICKLFFTSMVKVVVLRRANIGFTQKIRCCSWING